MVKSSGRYRGNGIFVCYRRADAAAFAGRLYDHLARAFPENVFMDVEDLLAGSRFTEEIQGVINKCAAFLVIIGPQWSELMTRQLEGDSSNDYVLVEIKTAVESGVPIIPVLIDTTTMPDPAELPDILTKIVTHNAIAIRHTSFKRDIAPLFLTLYDLLRVRPPTWFELFLGKTPGAPTVNERVRNMYAILSLLTGSTALLCARESGIHREVFLMSFFSLLFAATGKNSRKLRVLAWLGALLGSCAILALIAVKWG